jgi:hypothetical protein
MLSRKQETKISENHETQKTRFQETKKSKRFLENVMDRNRDFTKTRNQVTKKPRFPENKISCHQENIQVRKHA